MIVFIYLKYDPLHDSFPGFVSQFYPIANGYRRKWNCACPPPRVEDWGSFIVHISELGTMLKHTE